MTIVSAEAANSGWRLATESEVGVIFDQIFVNFVETNGNCYPGPSCGTSDTNYGAPTAIGDDLDYFYSLFGSYEGYPGSFTSLGMYRDENSPSIIREMGGGGTPSAENYKVYGMQFTWAADDTYFNDKVGTFLVRNTVVPIPAAVWLFGTALLALGRFRRSYPAP